MFTVTSLMFACMSTIINAGVPLPFNPNLQDNTTDPIQSLQDKLQTNQNPLTITDIDPNLQQPPLIPIKSNSSLTRTLATKYAIRIHKKPFSISNISSITQIYSTSKFTSTFAGALPTIIKLAYSRINMYNPKSLKRAQIAIRNFHQFMNILNINPMTINDMDDPQFLQLNPIEQLLILSSRAIVHQFAFTDIWDRASERYYKKINAPSAELYPWLNKQRDADCTLDVWKIIYWHSYDYLSRMIDAELMPLDMLRDYKRDGHEYVEGLMEDFGFIPWRRDVVERMSKVRDWEEFAECYAVGTSRVWEELFDDEEIAEYGEEFLAGFDMRVDYEKVMEATCDAVLD